MRVKGVTTGTNALLHPWLKQELTAILVHLPEPSPVLNTQTTRAVWERWQEGLSMRFTLPKDLPPLRMRWVLDTLAGHKTPEYSGWLPTVSWPCTPRLGRPG